MAGHFQFNIALYGVANDKTPPHVDPDGTSWTFSGDYSYIPSNFSKTKSYTVSHNTEHYRDGSGRVLREAWTETQYITDGSNNPAEIVPHNGFVYAAPTGFFRCSVTSSSGSRSAEWRFIRQVPITLLLT